MDETDLRLSLMLMKNSRMPYRELADRVNLSVNAVHNRVQNLIDHGIIEEFTTNISTKALIGSTVVTIYGKSNFHNADELMKTLSEDDTTFMAILAGGNYLYINGLLPDISEMSDYVESIPVETSMKDPRVLLPDLKIDYLKSFKFSKLDYKIIESLHKNSRKATSDVAQELNVSPKTIRRRINRMEKSEAIEYSIKWYPIHSDDFISFFHQNIKLECNRDKVISDIRKKYFPRIYEIYKASNHPQKIHSLVWSTTLKGIHNIERELRSMDCFESITPRMFYDVYYFDSWRQRLLKDRT